jgi:hypothetical protein
MANRPTFKGTLELTTELLTAMKKAGPNERGHYTLEVAVWPNTRGTSDRSPTHTGPIKVKGQKDSPVAYASLWVGDDEGPSSAPADDLF